MSEKKRKIEKKENELKNKQRKKVNKYSEKESIHL